MVSKQITDVRLCRLTWYATTRVDLNSMSRRAGGMTQARLILAVLPKTVRYLRGPPVNHTRYYALYLSY